MKRLLLVSLLALAAAAMRAQAVHDYASVEFSPGIRKLGVFGTGIATKVVDLKALHMNKRDLDIQAFFAQVQELEAQGWQLMSQDVVALDKGVHLYVWTMRKPRRPAAE